MGHTSGKSSCHTSGRKKKVFNSSFMYFFFYFMFCEIFFKSESLAVQLGHVKIQKPTNKHPDCCLTFF